MAGRKQHFIPQQVLRRFSKAGAGKQAQVWVYTHDGRQFPSSTEGVAAQREFYSKLSPGEVTLDDLITDHESTLVPFLSDVAVLEPGSTVDAQRAAEIIAHLTIRPAHVRDAFSSALDEMMVGLEAKFIDPVTLAKSLKLHEHPPGRFVRNMLNELWIKEKVELQRRGMTKDGFQRLLLHELRKMGPDVLKGSAPLMEMFFAMYRERRKTLVKDAHVRALKQTLAPERRVESLGKLDWTIHLGPPGGCILPDCVVTAVLNNGDCLPLFFADSDEIETVTMPLSRECLLVGTHSGVTPRSTTSEMAVTCAWDFFVAPDNTPEFDCLALHIGSRSRPYLRSLAQYGVSEAWPPR